MILYCVSARDIGIASIRYRAMLPALYLNRAGVSAQVVTADVDDDTLRRAECLVIVKLFNSSTFRLCWRAKRLRIPLILDLCDDIFDISYGGPDGDLGKYYFAGMADLSSLIVATTPVLADRIREHVPNDTPIHIIPDMVERASDVRELERLYGLPLIQLPIAKPKKHRSFPKKLRRKVRRVARKGWGALSAFWSQPELSKSMPTAESGIPDASTAMPPYPSEFDNDKVVLWFGHHGSPYSDTGMAQLLWLAADLEKLSREHPLRLVVVSSNRQKFDRYIRSLPFRTEYVEWNPEVMHAQFERADVCVVPFGSDQFSLAKSPNRIVLSLASGVPVVASPLPSLGPLQNSVLIEDWYASIKTYLERSDVARAHLSLAQAILNEHFHGSHIASSWRRSAAVAQQRHRAEASAHRVLFFFQLVQDFDLLVPLLQAASEECEVAIGILAGLALVAPSSVNALGKQGRRTFFLHESELSTLDPRDPRLACSVLVTASESSAGPHQFAAQLTKVVKANGIPTITLQHGVENIGLTFKDTRYDENISFESDFILTWGREERLAPWVSAATRSKIVPIGCPKPILDGNRLADFPLQDKKFVAVFENLHWDRYSDDFRARFLAHLSETARSFPDLAFVLKPHPAGQWFTVRRRTHHELPDNVIVADPKGPAWKRFGADALLAFAIGAITTPSSTAFDAARYMKPVAVVAGEMELEMYDPLPLLRSAEDWITFVRQVKLKATNLSVVQHYKDVVSVPGDPIRRAMAALRAASNRGDLAAVTEAVAKIGGDAGNEQSIRAPAGSVAALL